MNYFKEFPGTWTDKVVNCKCIWEALLIRTILSVIRKWEKRKLNFYTVISVNNTFTAHFTSHQDFETSSVSPFCLTSLYINDIDCMCISSPIHVIQFRSNNRDSTGRSVKLGPCSCLLHNHQRPRVAPLRLSNEFIPVLLRRAREEQPSPF